MERVNDASCGPSGCYTYQVSRHSTEMLHNLNQQRKNGGRFCDVLLRVGDESFPAHRAVLAACSEYFESVFSAQLGDGGAADGGPADVGGAAAAPGGGAGGSRELEMHTISSKVFGDILDFAYTSRIVVRLESFPELMTAAKFLLMRSVIEICQEVIKQSNVQILVPPARADIMLFRPPGTSDLGFPLDMTNGAALAANSNGIAGSMQPEEEAARAAGAAIASQASLPVLPGVDRLPMVAGPLSPQLLTSPFPNVASSAPPLTGKRGRGRPRKANLLDSMFGSPGGLREAGILPCGLCGKVFTDANRLRQHEAQHGVTSLQLGYIDLPPPRLGENGLPISEDPDGPRKRSRTRKQVACEICGKIFRDVYHLNRHKLSHSGEKPYSCPVCGLRFKRKDRMSYHVRSHDGSVGKPYICQSCGKGFSRPDHLNGHIKQVHTSERPHKCQTCNASFATRDRLRSHLACHEDKVPCQVCGKYLRAAYMADHLKKHSEGPSNFCSICNRGFSSASYLKVHVKTHHGVPLPQVSRHQEPIPNGGAAFHCARTYGNKGQKCSHQDPIESSDSYGDLSDASDLKTPEKQSANGSFSCDMAGPKNKMESDGEKKYPCPECGSFFRSKSYLNKHIQKVHVRALGGPLGDLGPALGSPFSPQQNMSLLESFGFQIVQSAFASSLVDPEVDQQPMGPEGK
ncbi:POZ-, AT hook-, and zinc finger-containing protein 1 isoform X2 [Mirounga angustirostris]|uniref:BTB/POZ domain zinc finger transcription factor n=1 Tax=Callorhinus ursinus TaxID=34884 RepID=A0A3Q7MZD8_CALUR|nr:POZ-, AT hook-, and zinc finger-containing protein 1 isoform X2 [Callorhinus ursinus]XP_027980447.1 POZ-, AT hook-, and zinc finger-containing protein 1 isoform X2 [Eumetopias jubatus]XP_034873293.1 POZ-, AT hook-, and zinc finger-containing protein 1 isoform X2 [Mirounga leonina]XP_035930445.1 POZ-, AT hook-, and zinc finger-containing protein 1 isoform X2 [Halichoerus grypus]XP_054366417.1 POZ-, AT hook-, and zinc finger-containing protein 1 isoform X2 [Mirounga angustirostris]